MSNPEQPNASPPLTGQIDPVDFVPVDYSHPETYPLSYSQPLGPFYPRSNANAPITPPAQNIPPEI